MGEFRKFVRSLSKVFTEKVGLKKFPKFESYSSCLPLYLATNGNPSSVVCLFKEATLLAHESETLRVCIADFEQAFEELVLPDLQINQNPFAMDCSSLIIHVNKSAKLSNG